MVKYIYLVDNMQTGGKQMTFVCLLILLRMFNNNELHPYKIT